MSTNNKKSSCSCIESSRFKQQLLFCLYILPPAILFFLIVFLDFPSVNLENFTPFILPSIAAGISLVAGLSSRNASISDRARSKATELLTYIKAERSKESPNPDTHERRKCLYDQMIQFERRFQLNQIALFIAWISLFMGLSIGIVLSYKQELYWISRKLPILIIGLLSYSFLVTLWDISLGSYTLCIELRNIEKFYCKQTDEKLQA